MSIQNQLFRRVSIAPLLTFRVLFGGLMAFGAIRFWSSGWIEKLYLEPQFFFKFYGFHWVSLPDEFWIYVLFLIIILSALGILFGLFYRVSAVIFFLSFTYSELLDATNYLNHYYLVCLLSFLLIFLPAHRNYSFDAWRNPKIKTAKISAWCIQILIFQLCCVYFFAGLAKVNYEWLFRAMPMAIWLPERVDTPIIGFLFQYKWVAFAFSWAGMLYDLLIWLFLLNKKTRAIAYVFVVIFHVLTKVLFNIGLFPVIMIFCTLIFFSAEWHERIWKIEKGEQADAKRFFPKKLIIGSLSLYCLFQLIFPLRSLLYQGNPLITEEAYRFSWRVMLVEKSGLATFYIEDSKSPRKQEIVNGNYLTLYQEKQMSIQPDFILQFAHFLKKEYEEKHGFVDAKVRVDAHVAINGRSSRQFIKPDVNLAKEKDTFAQKDWILYRSF